MTKLEWFNNYWIITIKLVCVNWWHRYNFHLLTSLTGRCWYQLKCERIAIKVFVCYETSDCNCTDSFITPLLSVPSNSLLLGVKLYEITTTIFRIHIHLVFYIPGRAHIWFFLKLIYLKLTLIFSKCVKLCCRYIRGSNVYFCLCEHTWFRDLKIEWCLCVPNLYTQIISNRSCNGDTIFSCI